MGIKHYFHRFLNRLLHFIKKTVLVTFLLIVSFGYLLQITISKGDFIHTDFGKFYQSLQFIQQGKSAYTPVYFVKKPLPHDKDQSTLKRLGPNLNPPFSVLLFLPLGLLSYQAAITCWLMLAILCGIFSTFLLLKALDPEQYSYETAWGLGITLFAYFPTYASINLSQVSLILLPLVSGSWLAMRRNKLALAGCLLGIACALKLFFALFILYFLLRREWQALRYFIITFLAINACCFLMLGKTNFIDYYHVFHFIYWYSSSWNASFLGFFARLFGYNELNTPLLPIPGLAEKLYIACSAFLIIMLIKFLQPAAKITAQIKQDLDFSAVLVAIFLLSPLGWIYYFVFLMVPFLILLKLAHQGYYPFTLRLLVFLVFILSSLPFYLRPPVDISNYIAILNWAGCYFYALIILCISLYWLRDQLIKGLQPAPDNAPEYLLIILYIVALLPSLDGIINMSHGLLSYHKHHKPKIDRVYFGESKIPHIYYY